MSSSNLFRSKEVISVATEALSAKVKNGSLKNVRITKSIKAQFEVNNSEDSSIHQKPELRKKALRICEQLNEFFPNPAIPLNHGNTFQFLVAVMLSAQTTDLKVNEVTPKLFERAPNAHAMSTMEISEIQSLINVLGLAPTKAKNLLAMSKLLVEKRNGEVPQSFEELEELPGVGHKTASVLMSQAFGVPAFAVDTHIHRLAERWVLSSGKSVVQTERDLKSLIPTEYWNRMHLQMIYFGRKYCPARGHEPRTCPICVWAAKGRTGSAEASDRGISDPTEREEGEGKMGEGATKVGLESTRARSKTEKEIKLEDKEIKMEEQESKGRTEEEKNVRNEGIKKRKGGKLIKQEPQIDTELEGTDFSIRRETRATAKLRLKAQ